MSAIAEANGWDRRATELYRKAKALPHGPEREELLRESDKAEREARMAWKDAQFEAERDAY